MGQQSEEEGAQYTSLGGPCVQCDGAGCVKSPSQEVQQYGVIFTAKCRERILVARK